MDTLLQDIRFALRTLAKAPGFAIVAVLTIALGIGANTVIFSVVDAVLLRPLPFRDPSRLVLVWENNLQRGRAVNVVGPANFVRWREQNKVFEGMAGGIAWPTNVNIEGHEPERVPVGIVSPTVFQVLGVRPIQGRDFRAEEEENAKSNVVILSKGYWERRFGGDPGVIGKKLVLSGQAVEIVGVMPDRVNFPEHVELWTPWPVGPNTRSARGRFLSVIARLKPGVTLAQAQAEMDVISSRTRAELVDFDAGWGVNVVALREQSVGDVRRALLVLLAAVGFVLLIACANVANLLLARASAREREIAVRIALGASRARVIRQLLTESLLLGVTGGAAGLGLAYWAMGPMIALLPREVPAFRPIGINADVLLFTLSASLVTGIVFGLAPSLRVSLTSPMGAMKETGQSVSASRGRHRLRSGLVIGETASAMVLLASAGLLLLSFGRLLAVDPGFEPDHVLTLQVSLPGSKYRETKRQVAYFEQALDKIRTVPGVEQAAAISFLPLDGPASATNFTVDDKPKPRPGEEPVGEVRSIMGEYFRVMGVQLLRGRTFGSEDHPDDSIKKVVINQAAAEALWPGQNAVGKMISMEWGPMLHAEVIGVVANEKMAALDKETRSTLYWYMPQFPLNFMSFVVRTRGNPMDAASAVRAQIASIDPEQPVAKIRTMDEIVGASVRQPRFVVLLLGSFAGLALLLAAIGIYGVVSYAVTQRTHELGIRMALGASRGDVLRLVVGEGMRLVLAGIVAGLVLALAATRLLTTLLFRTASFDAVAFSGVCVVLLAAALVATALPAWRAARLDPMVALRYE